MDNCFSALPKPRGMERNVSYQNSRSITFTKYYGMEKLKKAALAHIASQLTQSEVGALGDIFKAIDKDRSGTLSLDELDDALSGPFRPELKNQLFSLRAELDISGKQTLNWHEFLAATMDTHIHMQEDKILLAFDHFRQSNANALDMSDLIAVFGSEAQAQEVMGAVDMDRDGLISYEEFKNMMATNASKK